MRWSSSSALHRRGPPGERALERGAIEIGAERLGAQARERRRRGKVGGRHDVERAEAPGVVEREAAALLGRDHDMIVRPERGRIDSPMARHAEVEDQSVVAVGLDQPIFGRAGQAGSRSRR